VLFLAFRQFGLPTLIVAVPIIAMFLATLHFYFTRQEATEREAAERSSRERAQAAEREAAQTAQYLRELEQSDKRFQSAFTHAAVGMALVSTDGRVIQANRAMCVMLGRETYALVGREFREFVDPSDAGRIAQELQRIGRGDDSGVELELRLRHADGREIVASLHCGFFTDAKGSEACLIFQAFDVTARRLAEGRLQHMAYHDGLTNLANRSRLSEALAQAIAAHRSDPSHHFSVIYVDCERLKLLNESFGHGAGDQFLTMAAQRIKAQVGPADLVARLGGDEFAILVEHRGRGTHHAITLIERVQSALRAPFRVAGTEVSAGATIGVTFSDQGYRSPDEILRDADLARKKAKSAGKARYALFDPSLHQRATERLLLESDLRRGIASEQFALAFQPIFELGSRRQVGFEALARWQHPARGPISPVAFIPVAEESGLIVQLTQWAIQRACTQLRAWHDRDPASAALFVNVNISGHDLCDPKFADFVRETLDECSLRPSCLTLEITESTLMQQLEMAGGTLVKLRELGVGLSVDDFGTGYSSLSYLSSLPISSLKIDRSFVSRLEGRADDAEIVRAVIQLGDALGKRVIAEGIETAAQLERLARFGCSYGQGFLLSRPLTVQQVTELLDHPALDLQPSPGLMAATA
jgi:diguanylate cyclase (GGDEF)-like protein/PAS domain S-box-containing protein